MAPTLTTSRNILEQGIWQGPAQITLEDIGNVMNELVPEPTTTWRKDMTERSYDFPNNYYDIEKVPIQWMRWDPISTFVEDQNTRFTERYFRGKTSK